MSIVTRITTYEQPCDCGHHVRHNNGGNYHEIESVVAVSDDSGEVVAIFRISDDTREVYSSDEMTQCFAWPCGCIAIETTTKRSDNCPPFFDWVRSWGKCANDTHVDDEGILVIEAAELVGKTKLSIEMLWARPQSSHLEKSDRSNGKQ